MSACLNCGAALAGPFCAQCGQRDVPPYPTVREMAGDAWEELSGWDGRFVRTLGTLVRRPGQLTVDALEGRRARYIKPLRLYLVVSVIYFLLAAASPNLRTQEVVMPGGMVKIDVLAEGNRTPEQLAEINRVLARAPWWATFVMEPMLRDPMGFRQRMLERASRVFFLLVPILALLLAVVYRGRRYVQHLTFALHLQTMAFLALSLSVVAAFTGSLAFVKTLQAAAALVIFWYLIVALRRAYGGSQAAAVAKGVVFALLYGVALAAAMLAMVIVTVVLE